MRNFLFVFLLSVLLSGCVSEQDLTLETATSRALDKVPVCGNDLETFNKVNDSQEKEDGFLITIQQDCEPIDGEGPQMRSDYTCYVTNNEVKIVKDNN
ncbi:hypothetical protein QPK24_13155 [Paenibacillus polygoni]|uniref:Lipoprotein n=1 Tax=Paenibacillus polygoni TaxID=3050112 RepID=A0ABY8WYY7_9BACL|nr:hypothetical protein [Paenibacillus polygoni]WIV17382.1 hypothetical protein QPK24_13155 [Paenibacillus polygoni]